MNQNKCSCKLYKKTCLSGFYLYLSEENATNYKLWNITLYLLIDLKTKFSEDWHQVKNIFKISAYVVWLDSKNLSLQKFFCNSIILHAKTAYSLRVLNFAVFVIIKKRVSTKKITTKKFTPLWINPNANSK